MLEIDWRSMMIMLRQKQRETQRERETRREKKRDLGWRGIDCIWY